LLLREAKLVFCLGCFSHPLCLGFLFTSFPSGLQHLFLSSLVLIKA
jgi:hypothetical protein